MGEDDGDGAIAWRRELGEPGENREFSANFEPQTSYPSHAPDVCRSAPPAIDESLARTIQGEIIPRLLLAHRARSAAMAAQVPEPTIAQDEVASLVALSITEPLPALRTFVDTLQARGLGIESIVGELLPAAARHVGWMWETDACTFVDVTCSLTRLQQLLRHYAPALSLDISRSGEGRRMLLSSMPGEQHTFGIAVAEEFFRQAAWEVAPQMPADARTLVETISAEWFDIVGLSASGDAALAAMPALIRTLRERSMNQSLRVIVGGAAVQRHPAIAAEAGADSIARDARDGIEKMEWMMQALRQPC